MKAKQAIKMLKNIGFDIERMGKGDHILLRSPDNKRIVLQNGALELSPGLTGKVRSLLQKGKLNE